MKIIKHNIIALYSNTNILKLNNTGGGDDDVDISVFDIY
jgi:hypothetical protein